MANLYHAWKFYYELNIQNPPATSGFQASFSVNYLPGMRYDFRDVRFSDKYGNRLYYFIDSFTAFGSAKFFIKLPANDTIIHMHYGNGAVISESSGSSVFDFYDDFTSLNYSKWKLIKGSASVSNSILSLAHPTRDTVLESLQTFSTGCFMEANLNHRVGGEFKAGFRNDVSRRASVWAGHYNSNDNDHRHTDNSSSVTWVNDGVNRGGSTYYIYGVTHLTAGPRFYINGSYRGTITTNTPGSTALPIELYAVVNSGTLKVNWVRVRKYLTNEPVITLGSKHVKNNSGFLKRHDYLYDTTSLSISSEDYFTNYIKDTVTLKIDTGLLVGQVDEITDTVNLQLSQTEHLINRNELRDYTLISCSISKSIEDKYTQLSAEFADGTYPPEGATVKYFAHDYFDMLEILQVVTDDDYPVYTSDNYPLYIVQIIYGYPVYTADGYQVTTSDDFTVYSDDVNYPDIGHLLFTGKNISSIPTLSFLGNSIKMDAADVGRNLTVQNIPWQYQVIKLSEEFPGWENWIRELLDTEKTGVRAGNIIDSGLPDKQFVFKPKTSRYDALSEIVSYLGCVMNIKNKAFFINGIQTYIPSLYVAPAADIDKKIGGFDLPDPIEFTYPDDSIENEPTITGAQGEKYNKVIIHGVLSDSGETTVAAAYTPAVDTGEEKANEFIYEDNNLYEKESTAEIEAIKWLLYFTAPIVTVSMKFNNRYDLELYQRIRFGEGFPTELKNLTNTKQLPYVVVYDPREEDHSKHNVDVSGVPKPTWLRITNKKYHSSEVEETCEISAITDFIYSSVDDVVLPPYSTYIAAGYLKPVSDDTVSTVQSVVTDTVEKQLTPEICTIISIDDDNQTMVVQTQSGKLVTVRYG